MEFLDIWGGDLLTVVEEYRDKWLVLGSINATFLSLIPKISKFVYFNDYKPISLCNLIYKFIAKFIANRIKPRLNECTYK